MKTRNFENHPKAGFRAYEEEAVVAEGIRMITVGQLFFQGPFAMEQFLDGAYLASLNEDWKENGSENVMKLYFRVLEAKRFYNVTDDVHDLYLKRSEVIILIHWLNWLIGNYEIDRAEGREFVDPTAYPDTLILRTNLQDWCKEEYVA
jgi:hypothetical protein